MAERLVPRQLPATQAGPPNMNNSHVRRFASAAVAAALMLSNHGALADEPPLNLPVHVVHNFVGQAGPMDSMVKGPDGTLYGVTPHGSSQTRGTIFKLGADDTFATIASFTQAGPYVPMPHLVFGG